MIETSQAYKDQVQEAITTWYPSGIMDYTDFNIDNSITTTVNSEDNLSDPQQMSDGIETPSYEFMNSWEHYDWDQHLRSEESTNNEKGALSQRISEDDNTFPVFSGIGFGSEYGPGEYSGPSEFIDYPKFRINFSPRTITALKAIFDDKRNQYAVDFDINVYTDDYETPEHTENITGNTSYRWETVIAEILLATAVEIVIKEWSHSKSKAIIIEAFTSFSESYDETELLEFNVFEESESQSDTNPIGNITVNTCTGKLLNLNRKFDNDNEDSVLHGKVKKNRRFRPAIVLNDLIDDKIQLGQFFTTQWEIDNDNLFAEFSAQDLFGLMEGFDYKESQFITPGIDQVFTYTTTADFNSFDLENIESTDNKLLYLNSAVLCDESLTPYYGFGEYIGFGEYSGPIGYLYYGTADKQISFTYTPGVSVTIDIVATENIPNGCNILYYASWKTVEEFNLMNGKTITYTPEDPTDTSQVVKIRAFFISNSTATNNFSIEDIEVTISEKVTLYSLAAKLINDFDNVTNLVQGKYEIAQEYANYEIPYAFFEPQNYKKVMKKIASAAGGRAYQRKDNYIVFEGFVQTGTAVREFDETNTFERNNPVNPYTQFNRVTVYIYEYILSAAAEDVGKVNVIIQDTEVQNLTIKFKIIPCDDATVAYSGLPGGVTVTDETIYTWGVEIELTNASGSDQDFTLTIEAKTYETYGSRSVQLDDSTSIRENGIIELPIENYLIQTYEQAYAVATIILNNLKQLRRDLTIDITPDPSIEIGDTIKSNDISFLVNRSELVLNAGGLIHILGGKKT